MSRKIKISIPGRDDKVSGIVSIPDDAICVMALAHGAGAGMEHSFMEALSDALNRHGIGVMRFNFPYKEAGGRRPDSPKVAHATQQGALTRAADYATKLGIPVVAGGKSFGGRMFSQLAAKDEDFGAAAIVYFGFPLHAPGKPGMERAAHLKDIKVPMLFLQGTRDTLATPDLIKVVSKGLRRGKLVMIEGADHGFHMLKRSGISDEETIERLAKETRTWLDAKLK